MRPINRSEVIEGVYADLHFDQDRITLDTLSARQGRTGRVWARGVVQRQERDSVVMPPEKSLVLPS